MLPGVSHADLAPDIHAFKGGGGGDDDDWWLQLRLLLEIGEMEQQHQEKT